MGKRKDKKGIKILTIVMVAMLVIMAITPYQAGSLSAYAESGNAETVAESSELNYDAADNDEAYGGNAANNSSTVNSENSGSEKNDNSRSENNNDPCGSENADNNENSGADNTGSNESVKADDSKSENTDGSETKNKEDKKAADSKLTFKNKDYSVSVSFDKDAQIPKGTKLDVKEITKKKEQFDAYYEKAVDSVQKNNSKNERTKLSFVKFYDISLVKDGKEIEPAGGVDVEIAYKSGQASELKAKDAESIRVIHFKKTGNGENDKPVLIPKKDSSVDISSGHLKKTGFETDSFSVFAVAYTVDFHFENKDYSIAGESSITLSELFKKLDMELDVRDVENVEFSDPSLVKVETIEGKDEDGAALKDWKLTSLQPFSTNEKLTLTTIFGQLVINVTDAPAGDAYGQFITTDQIKSSVANRKNTDIKVYFLLPDGKTLSDYSFTIASGELYANKSEISSALTEFNKTSSIKYRRSNEYYYYVYDATRGAVDMKDGRGDLFKINGSVYYCDYYTSNSSLSGSAKENEDNRINIKNNINDNKYKLLDGDKIVIPLSYKTSIISGIKYKGLKYTLEDDGKMELTGYDSSYSGVPELVDLVEYQGYKFPVKDITWFQANYTSYLKGKQLKFSDGMLEKMTNHNTAELPDVVKDLPESDHDKVSEENGYIPGKNNSDKEEQIWKKAVYNEDTNSIEYTIRYFKKMHDPEDRDFVFSFDESASMIDISDSEYGLKAPRMIWMMAQAQVAARSVVEANEDGYKNRVAFVTWNNTASCSSYFETKEDVDEWFASTSCWSHVGGSSDINNAVKAMKPLVSADRNVVIMNMSDFKVSGSSASTYLKASTNGGKFKTYAIAVFSGTSYATPYQNSGAKSCYRPEGFITVFDNVIKDAIGYYIPSKTKVTDELGSAIKDKDVSGLSVSSGSSPEANAGTVTWTLGDQSPKLTAGKLYTETFKVQLGDPAYSGSISTNGKCEISRSDEVINSVDSPVLKKDLNIILKEDNKNGAAINSASFELYEGDLSESQMESNDPIWNGTSDANGKLTIPYGEGQGKCTFPAGSEYTLKQTETADGYALPAFTWKITVDNKGIISGPSTTRTDSRQPAEKVRSLGMASVSGNLEVYNENYTLFEISNNSGSDFNVAAILASSNSSSEQNLLSDPGVFLVEDDEWKAAPDPRSFVVADRTKITLAVPASAGKDFNLDGSFLNPDRTKEIPVLIIDKNGNEEKKTITENDHHFKTKDYIVGQFADKGGKVTVQFGEEIVEPVVPTGLPDLSAGRGLPLILVIMTVTCAAFILREFLSPIGPAVRRRSH